MRVGFSQALFWMGEKKRRQAVATTLAERVATAQALHAAGKLGEAQDAYRDILHVDATLPDAWFGLGLIARGAGDRARAVQYLAKAVAHAPDNWQARMHYAAVLQDMEDFDAAIAQWRMVCAAQAGNAVAWECLGIAEQAAGRSDEAVRAYRRAIELEPAPALRVKLATAISPIPSSRDAIATERARMHEVLDAMLAEPAGAEPLASEPMAARLWTNFYLAYHGENDRDLQQKTAAVYRRICPLLDFAAAHCAQRRASGARIRIGLISQFFRTHSIGRTSRGLFAQLSR